MGQCFQKKEMSSRKVGAFMENKMKKLPKICVS